MSDEFEEIVSDLDDIAFKPVEVIIADNAKLSGAFIPHEIEGCECNNSLVIMSLILQGDNEPLLIGVYPTSPLGQAFLSGEFEALFAKRLDEMS